MYIYIDIYIYIYVYIYVYILHTQRDVQISELRNVDFEAPKNSSRHWEGPHLVQAQMDSQSSWSSAGSCHRWMIWSWVYLWKLLFWTSYGVKVSFFQPTSMIHVQIPNSKITISSSHVAIPPSTPPEPLGIASHRGRQLLSGAEDWSHCLVWGGLFDEEFHLALRTATRRTPESGSGWFFYRLVMLTNVDWLMLIHGD